MSYVTRQAAHCDQCSHEWLVVGASTPTHCAKCKSRRWNGGTVAQPDRAPAPRQEEAGSIPAVPIIEKGTRTATGIIRMIESKRQQHDLKACRIYKCGMCAALAPSK